MGSDGSVRSSSSSDDFEPFEHVDATFYSTKAFNFPKVELHCHLDGCFRLETVVKYAKARSIELPSYDIDKLRHYCCGDTSDDSSLAKFLKKMQVFVRVFQGSRDAIRELTLNAIEDKAKDGVVYIEFRYCPQLLATAPEHAEDLNPVIDREHPDQLKPSEVVETVNKAIEDARHLYNRIKVRTILCCITTLPEISMDVARLIVRYRHQGVVGIDIAGEEAIEYSPEFEPHIHAFQYARAHNIHRTAHAGEAGDADSVTKAQYYLSAERIGHGYHVLRDSEIYKKIISDQMHLECCPISSYRTGSVKVTEVHPLVQFVRDKVNCSINTDDPGFMLTALTDDYRLCLSEFGMDESVLKLLNLNAAKSSFLPDDEKKELVAMLEQHYGKLN